MPAELLEGQENTPLTFSEMQRFHKFMKQRNPALANMDLETFSKKAKQATGSSAFDQGLEDTYTKRYSAALDRFISPIAEPVGRATASAFDAIGLGNYRNLGQEIGKQLPRGIAESAATAAGFAMLLAPEPFVTKAAGLGLMGLGAGSAYAGGFEKSGSRGVGALSAASMATFPAVARFGQAAVKPLIQKALYNPVITKFNRVSPRREFITYVPKAGQGMVHDVAERAFEYGGVNAALTAHQVGFMGLERKSQGLPFMEFTPEYAIEVAGGQLPFALVDALRIIKGPTPLRRQGAGTGPVKDWRSQTAQQLGQQHAQVLAAKEQANAVAAAYDREANFRKLVSKQRILPEWHDPLYTIQTEFDFSPPKPAPKPKGYVEERSTAFPMEFRRWNNILAWVDKRGKVSLPDLKHRFRLSDTEAESVIKRLEDRAIVRKGATLEETRETLVRQTTDGELLAEAQRVHAWARGQKIEERPVLQQGERKAYPEVSELPFDSDKVDPNQTQEVVQTPETEGYYKNLYKEPALPESEKPLGEQTQLPLEHTTGKLADNTAIEERLAERQRQRDTGPFKQHPVGDDRPMPDPRFTKGTPPERKPLITDAQGREVVIPQVLREGLRRGTVTQEEFDRWKPIWAKGTEAEQLIVEFMERYGQDDTQRLLLPQGKLDPEEQYYRVVELAQRIHSILLEAGDAGEPGLYRQYASVLSPSDSSLRWLIKQEIAKGRTPVEAAEMARRSVMFRLGAEIERTVRIREERTKQTWLSERKPASLGEDSPMVRLNEAFELIKEIKRLVPGEMAYWDGEGFRTVDYAKAITEIASNPDIRKFTTGDSVTPGDVGESSRTWVFAAAAKWFKTDLKTRQELVRKWTKNHPDQAKELHPYEIEVETFKRYIYKAALLKQLEHPERRIVTAVGGTEEIAALQKGVGEPGAPTKGAQKVPLTPEKLAEEAEGEDRTGMLAVQVRQLVPIKEYTPLEIRVAMERAGVTKTKVQASLQNMINQFVKLFYDNRFTFGPDPQNKVDGFIIKVLDWDAVGKAVNQTNHRIIRKYIDENFKPFMQGMLKGLQRTEQDSDLGPEGFAGKSMGVTETVDPKTGKPTPAPASKPTPPSTGVKPSPIPPEVLKDLLRPGATKFAAMAGAKAYFRTYFAAKGFSEGDVVRMTDIAQKVAAAYYDVGWIRIGEMVGDTGRKTLGLHHRKAGTPQTISLNSESFIKNPHGRVYRQLRTLGHELWHGVVEARLRNLLPEQQSVAIDNIVNSAFAMTKEQRAAAYLRWERVMVPASILKDKDMSVLALSRSVTDGADPQEFLSDIAGMIGMSVASPDFLTSVKPIGKELVFSDHHEQQFMKQMYLPVQDIYESLAGYFSGPGGDTKLATDLGAISNGIKNVLKSTEFTEKALNALNSMRVHDPQGYMKLLSEEPLSKINHSWLNSMKGMELDEMSFPGAGKVIDTARSFLGLSNKREIEKAFGIKPYWFESWFYPAQQLAQAYPQLGDVIDAAFSFHVLMKENIIKALTPFGAKQTKDGRVIVDHTVGALRDNLSDPKLRKAASEVSLVKQLDTAKVLANDEIMEIINRTTPGLSDEQKEKVLRFHRASEKAMPIMADQIVKHKTAEAGMRLAGIIQAIRDPVFRSMKAEQAIDLGNTLLGMAMTDPATNPGYGDMLNKVLPILGPDRLKTIGETATVMAKGLQKLAMEITNRPSFMPELRLGEFVTAWTWPKGTKGHTAGRAGFKTELEAISKMNELKSQGAMAKVFAKSDQYKQNMAMDQNMIQRYAEIDAAAMEAAVKAIGNTPELEEFKANFVPGRKVLEDAFTKTIEGHLKHRKLAEGRETIDTAESVVTYFSTMSAAMAKQYIRTKAAVLLRDPKLKENPKLQALGRDHIETVTNPPAREATFFKNLNFAYFMGFNLSTMLIEASQNFLTFAPFMTKALGRVQDGYMYLGKGVKAYTAAQMNKGIFKDPELQKAVELARNQGVVDAGTLQDLYGIEDVLLPNLRNLASGNESLITKASELAGKPAWWYLKATRWMYSHAPRTNAHVAFAGAFMAAKEKLGMDFNQAYDFAKDATRTTQYSGGLAARPVRLFNPGNEGGWGAAHPLVGILYSLQGYTFSTLAMMARLGKEAISSDPAIPAQQKRAAQKAFGQMMLTQFAFGGALSMPFTAGMIALLEQMFPDLELKKGIRSHVERFFQSDEEMGSTVADVALKGGLTALTGADFSTRFGLGNLFGVSSFDGFSLANLVGPTGQIFENLARGIQQGSSGDLGGAAQSMLPIAYRNVLDLATNGGVLRDKAGQLLYEPSAAESLLYSIGLKPNELSNYREAQSMARRTNDIAARELEQFHQRNATLLESGAVGTVRQDLLSRSLNDPLYDVGQGSRRVSELATERMLPADMTRSGPRSAAGERQSISSMFGLPVATETQRLMQRQQFERLLGLPSRGDSRELTSAQMVDALMSQGLDRITARQIATRQFGANTRLD